MHQMLKQQNTQSRQYYSSTAKDSHHAHWIQTGAFSSKSQLRDGSWAEEEARRLQSTPYQRWPSGAVRDPRNLECKLIFAFGCLEESAKGSLQLQEDSGDCCFNRDNLVQQGGTSTDQCNSGCYPPS